MKRSHPAPNLPPGPAAGGIALPIIADPLGGHSTLTTALSTPNPLALITDDMREVDHVIAQRLTTTVPLIAQISQYIIAAGGKRLRPALLLMVCNALGYERSEEHTSELQSPCNLVC